MILVFEAIIALFAIVSVSWKLNGVRKPKKEIEALVEELNIQVGNLCQFLPQDKVHRSHPVTFPDVGNDSMKWKAKFIRSLILIRIMTRVQVADFAKMSPEELLENTQKAVDPTLHKRHDELKTIRAELKRFESSTDNERLEDCLIIEVEGRVRKKCVGK